MLPKVIEMSSKLLANLSILLKMIKYASYLEKYCFL